MLLELRAAQGSLTRIWLYCISAAVSDNGSMAFQVNLIAAVVLRDDVHNDGGSRASQ